MSTPVAIRPARPSDLPGVVEVYNHFVETSPATFEVAPVRPEDRRTWFAEHPESGPHRLLVAVDASEAVLGWASTSTFRPRAAYATSVEASVYCRPSAQHVGLGSRLYAELFRSIQQEDVERIVAGVTLPNPPSMSLHRRFGFRSVGTFTRVGRKFGQFWDVTWMERPLRLEAEDPFAHERKGSSELSRRGSGLVVDRVGPERAADLMRTPELFGRPPDVGAVEAYLSDDRNLFLLATVQGRRAGFLRGTELGQISTPRHQMFLYEVGVLEPYRRGGVGRALVDRALVHCRARGLEEMFVFTDPSNVAAVNLYRTTGAVTETPADRMFVYRL